MREVEDLARFSSEDPFPVMRISSEGVLLYGNSASQVLLKDWKTQLGEQVPEKWVQHVKDVFSNNQRKVIEQETSGQVVSFVIVPVQKAGYVNLYGRDVTREKEIERNEKCFYINGLTSGQNAFDINAFGIQKCYLKVKNLSKKNKGKLPIQYIRQQLNYLNLLMIY